MSYIRNNVGTCSKTTEVFLKEDGTVEKVIVVGGCKGNLKGIMKMLEGMKAQDAISVLRGITCGDKGTSCPDQISLALEEALANVKQ